MRISDWSSDVCSSDLSPFPALAGQRPKPVGMQGQRHARPLPRRIIREFHLAIMLFDDLLDDREAQPGAALPRRHIGLGDRVARLRQPDSVVGDDDADDIAGAYIELRVDRARTVRNGFLRLFFDSL